MDDFYQNQRLYYESKSNAQLSGDDISFSEAKWCHPFITNSDIDRTESWTKHPLDEKAIANPCGSRAYSVFNDTFSLFHKDVIVINETGISWPGDKGQKYHRSQDSDKTQWIDP